MIKLELLFPKVIKQYSQKTKKQKKKQKTGKQKNKMSKL